MGNSVMLNGGEYAGEQIAYKDSTYELVDVYKRQRTHRKRLRSAASWRSGLV